MSEIIATRKKQGPLKLGIAIDRWFHCMCTTICRVDNFQLICITHDEEFVEMLGKAQVGGASNPGWW
jgi:hypothetical protein